MINPNAVSAPLLRIITDLSVPNEFVVGYGLDYAGTYRNLPFVGVLKDEVHAD